MSDKAIKINFKLVHFIYILKLHSDYTKTDYIHNANPRHYID